MHPTASGASVAGGLQYVDARLMSAGASFCRDVKLA